MTRSRVAGLMAAAMAVCLAAPAVAGGPKVAVLADAARAAPNGRGVSVAVSQGELDTNINASNMTVAMGGGLLGVVIDAKIESDRGKRAEAGITPIRAALVDVDADQLAIDTTAKATAALAWFNGKTPDFTRDPTNAAKSARLDAGPEGQVAFFDYVYDTSADFASIRVGVHVTLANKDGPKAGEDRLGRKSLAYDQNLTAVVLLRDPADAAYNSKRWAENNGALARQALTLAFAEMEKLIPRALAAGPDEAARWPAGAEATPASGYRGKLVEETPDGTLLFNGSLVHVQTMR